MVAHLTNGRVGTTLKRGDPMLAVSFAISATTTTKVIANSAPGIRYNAFATASATPKVEIKPVKNKTVNLKDFFKYKTKEQKKLSFKTVFKSDQKMNIAPTIFGTIYDSKTFLTAISSLSIDKQDISPLLTVPCTYPGARDGSLVYGGVTIGK